MTTPTLATLTRPAHRLVTRAASTWAAVWFTVLTVTDRVRGDQPVDDRGSDSSEKAFMVILAITIGTAVSIAAVAFVSTKTAMFK